MRNRYGVIMVLFDLPVETTDDRRAYNQFRTGLIRSGYCYFHDSVYVKLLRNISSAGKELDRIGQIAPPAGSVRALPMSMAVFQGLQNVRGEPFNMNLFADDVIVIEDGKDD